MTFSFWNCYVLKLLHLETVTFSDATLSDINVVLCYVLSQYRLCRFNLKLSTVSFIYFSNTVIMRCMHCNPFSSQLVFNLTLCTIVDVNGTHVEIVNIRVSHLTVHELPFRWEKNLKVQQAWTHVPWIYNLLFYHCATQR